MAKKILVADDDPGIVDAMRILLEDEGYEVIVTLDAENILKLYEEKPDLLFLDIWMSGTDGNTVCKMLKGNDPTKNVPIIIFSANRDIEAIARECGADDFLLKPFEIKDLIAMVKKYTD